MGTEGEEEALKHLDDDDFRVKERCCRVLKEAGTKKSLAALGRQIDKAKRLKYPGYAAVVTACEAAREQIKRRGR
jgi:hypothetical protein